MSASSQSNLALDIDVFWKQGDMPARAKFQSGNGITALIGPSGAGKTTLARLLAGLEKPLDGRITINSHPVYHAGKNRSERPEKRNIGFVFQDNALMPHLTVKGNLAFSPHSNHQSVQDAITVTGLRRFIDDPVNQLSGGEKKRVAIARAIAAKPQLLILDEPFTGLHGPARAELMGLVQKINRNQHIPVLLITHQLEEVLQLADHAILMSDGQARVHGTLEEVLSQTDALRLVGFEDAGSLLKGKVVSVDNGLCRVDLGGDHLVLADADFETGSEIILRVRANDVAISLKAIPDISIINQLEATIASITQAATHIELVTCLAHSDAIVRARISQTSFDALKLREGQNIVLLIKALSVKETSGPTE